MTDQNPSMHLTVEETAQNLAAFAVDRTDLKTILHSLPPESGPNRVTLEYELGMLKILTVGWGISFSCLSATKTNRSCLKRSGR